MFFFILALHNNHGKCPEGVRFVLDGVESIMNRVYIDKVYTSNAQFYGSFCAPVTGEYQFHINGQSAIVLKLGTIYMDKKIIYNGGPNTN